MRKVYGSKNKNYSRPKKTGTAKRQRMAAHKARLINLGVDEAKVNTLTPGQMRELLKRPARLQK